MKWRATHFHRLSYQRLACSLLFPIALAASAGATAKTTNTTTSNTAIVEGSKAITSAEIATATPLGVSSSPTLHKSHIDFLSDMLEWAKTANIPPEKQAAVDAFWQELSAREQKLKGYLDEWDKAHPNNPMPLALEENAMSLFLFNNLHDDITDGLKEHLGMPASTVEHDDYHKLKNAQTHPEHPTTPLPISFFSWFEKPVAGYLDKEGNLYNPTKFSQLDPGWTTSLTHYLSYQSGHTPLAPMNPPTVIDLSDHGDISIIIVGDWGTGYWNDSNDPSPAQLVMNSMQQHNADIAIHLGDEYYAGTRYSMTGGPGEEATNFTDLWNPGTPLSFILGSNHSMYDGENGLRYITLESDKFAAQNKTTTFAIELENWIIVGLDTARHDPSPLFQNGALDSEQGHFLHKMGKKGKKVLLLSHHTGVSFDGRELNQPLWDQVVRYLGRAPEYWIWGHIHQGINYSNESAAGDTVCRVWGHGAIPVGKASSLLNDDGSTIPEVSYYSHNPYPHPDELQKLRIRNGYGILRFSGDTVQEELYDQYGNVEWVDHPKFPQAKGIH